MFNRFRPMHDGDPTKETNFESVHTFLAREHRVLWMRGGIFGAPDRWDVFSVSQVHDSILGYNYEDARIPAEERTRILLFVDSTGGSVSDGLVLVDAIRMSVTPVVTVLHNAASMATLVAAAGHRRLAYPHARLMLHLPKGGNQGDYKDMEAVSREVKRITEMLADAYVECGVKRTREEILADIDRQVWLDVSEAIAYGLVDAVVTVEDLYPDLR